MKILFFTRRFYPQIGGVEKHVMEISKRLSKEHSVVVVTEDIDTPADTIVNGIEIVRIPVGKADWWKKFRIWQGLWKNRQLIKDADVIHCHDVFFWYFPFRFLYPLKRVYTTFHGYESYPVSRKAVLMRKLSERLSRGNICIGDFIKKWYGTRPTYVSYGAVDTRSIRTEPLHGGRKESALFIGRLDDQTGILTYVKAVERLRRQFPKFDCLVVGDGEYRTRIKDKVRTLGFRDHPEEYLPQYRFAFVSRYLSILEAFVAKRLVFAVYDNPIKKDYLLMAPYSEWIVCAQDEKELSEKVAYFLKHPDEERTKVEAAYAWVRGQTWAKMMNIYLLLWRV